MLNKSSIRELIDIWPSVSQFSKDIGCGYEAARKMRARNRIAPEHWENVLRAARGKGLSWVTTDWLISSRAQLNNGISRPDVEAVVGAEQEEVR